MKFYKIIIILFIFIKKIRLEIHNKKFNVHLFYILIAFISNFKFFIIYF